jgi:hypothetical protein
MIEALPGVLSLSNGMSQTLAGALTLIALLVYRVAQSSALDRVRRAPGGGTERLAATPTRAERA